MRWRLNVTGLALNTLAMALTRASLQCRKAAHENRHNLM